VAKNPEARPPVIESDGTSRYFKRLDLVVDTFQVRNHLLERHAIELSNVLTNEPRRSAFFDDSEHFRPEPTVIVNASAPPASGARVWLAREPSSDDIGESSFDVQRSDVVVTGDVGPVLFENGSTEWIDFAESNRSHSRSLEAEGETTDSRYEVEYIHALTLWVRDSTFNLDSV
jgi:hypothetical protein